MASSPSKTTRQRLRGGLSSQGALLATTALLCVLGLIMVWSASSVVAISLYGSSWSLVAHEVEFMVAGVVVLLGLRWFGYRRLAGASRYVIALGFAGLAAVELVGVSSMGSARWIRLPMGFTVQPSEIMKFALAVFTADRVARGMAEGADWKDIAKAPALVTLVAAGTVLLQPDMGTAVVLVLITLAVLTVAGLPKRSLLASLGLLGLVGLVAAVAQPYRMARLTSFLHRSANDQAGGYQVTQSLVGFGAGGVTGSGLGNSKEKWGLLPNPHTDFIFSVIGEELGFIGTVLVIALFVVLIVVGMRIARNASDRTGQLMATAITTWIGAEAIINVAASVGWMPVTGIPLPFISFGGTALICTLGAVGVLADIARKERQLRPGGRRPKARPSAAKARAKGAARSSATQGSRRPTVASGAAAGQRPRARAAARPPAGRQAKPGR